MTPLERRQQSGLSRIFDVTEGVIPDLGTACASIQRADAQQRDLDSLASEIQEREELCKSLD